ncbi:hypothetical protein AO242_25510 [Pseudomonas sp. ICMP 561]|nr:hypothetical protein AO242_25510 [Pseudomonas sp. ICMP 561]
MKSASWLPGQGLQTAFIIPTFALAKNIESRDIKQGSGLAIGQFVFAHALQNTQLERSAVMDLLLSRDARDTWRLVTQNPLAKR